MSKLLPKELKDFDYPDLIAETTGHMVQGLTRGEKLSHLNQYTIDLTIAWLKAKGKMPS